MATDHRLLIGGIGAFGIAAAGGMYLWRNAIPGWVLDAAGATVALAVGILAAVAITPTGVLGLSPALFAVCILNGYFATSKALGWQLAWASASFLTGVLLAQKPATLIPAVNAIVVAVVSSVILNRLAERMRQQSSFDALTGAYNRTAWWQIAEHTLQDPDQTLVSVAILDLDNFKKVNDSQGHLAGDSLLQSAAQKWLHDLNPPSVLGRFGGDEFVILFPGLTAAEAEQELMRLGPIPHHTWSFGIAGAQPKDTVPMLLHRADTALLEAKKLRRQQEKPGNGADRSTSDVIGTNNR